MLHFLIFLKLASFSLSTQFMVQRRFTLCKQDTYHAWHKVSLRDVGDVEYRGCRKSERYMTVTPLWLMLEQKGVILLLLHLLLLQNDTDT